MRNKSQSKNGSPLEIVGKKKIAEEKDYAYNYLILVKSERVRYELRVVLLIPTATNTYC